MKKILKESDIPIPLPLLDVITKDIKSHIVSWILTTLIENRDKSIKNRDKDTDPEAETIFKPIIQKQTDRIEKFKKDYSKYIINSNPHLDNFGKTYRVPKYLSSYKYTIPEGFDDELTVIHYFDYRLSGTRGDYNHRTKTISLYAYMWEDFLEEARYMKDYNAFQIKDLTKFEIQIEDCILSIQAVLAHELTHYTQLTFVSKADWKFINTKDDNFDKYISSEMEFYPKLKGAYYNYLQKYYIFDKGDFEKFVDEDSFFNNLKQADYKQYNRAIKQLYLALQNTAVQNKTR